MTFELVDSTQKNDRLKLFLGPFNRLLTPAGTLIFFLCGWALSAPFTSSIVATGLCWFGLAMLLIAIQFERHWINDIPFAPLTALCINMNLHWVLGGIILLTVKSESSDLAVWTDNIKSSIPINATVNFITVTGCILINKWVTLKKPKSIGSNNVTNISPNQILILECITGFIAIGYILTGFISGSTDRGLNYLDWAGKLWRPDTLFSAVIKLRDIYYILLPVMFLKFRHNYFVIGTFGILTTISLGIPILSGGRGLILYPLVMLIGGLWLAKTSIKLLQALTLFLLAGSLIFSTLIPIARNQLVFVNSSSFDLHKRFESIRESIPALVSAEGLGVLGRDLYAASDPYLFKEPGSSLPPQGNKNLSNLVYVWIPKLLKTDRPEINDGHLIAKELIGDTKMGVHEGRHIWFPNISYGGDLYRRYRWTGVVIGSLLFSVIYGLACRFWYKTASLQNGLLSLLIAIYPSTFIQSIPLRSVSETAWNWLYEIPKYGLILLFLSLAVNKISGQKTIKK